MDKKEWEDTDSKPKFIRLNPNVLAQVKEAMANCEDNGYWDETISLSAEDLTDDLMDKDGDLGKLDRDVLLVAVRTFKAQHPDG